MHRGRLLIVVAVVVAVTAGAVLLGAGGDDGPSAEAPGWAPRPDARAADRVESSGPELRPANTAATRRRPTADELERFRVDRRAGDPLCPRRLEDRVTGAYAGTTDEILQWAAAKWGFDADLFRAVAVAESTWDHGFVGDRGESFGIMQVRRTFHTGTFPLARDSLAFNADYYGAVLRHYFEGCAPWLNREERGEDYEAGDLWGSVGAWFAGRWRTPDAEAYIDRVRTVLEDRTWTSEEFAAEGRR